jgi:hypothetical protein
MRRFLLFFAILSFGNLLNHQLIAAPPLASIGIGVNFGFFYSSLSPHGEWIEVESGFHVWRPQHINRYWRPYISGQWIWTDYGWYWMSNEPYGWITYHYGRWYCDDYYGWVWVPDDVWGPAWVEWRYDNDYIGWAPLPPYATFNVSVGIHFTNHWIAPARYWNFVRYRHFGNVHRYRDMVPENNVRRLLGRTRSDYRYRAEGNRIINNGVDRTIIERRGNIRIRQVSVQEERKQSGERLIRSNNGRNPERIEIYRPTRDELQRNVERTQVRRGDRNLSLDMKKIERSQIESRSTPENRVTPEPRKEQKRERVVQPQEQRRKSKPRIREQKAPSNKQERRRELIQRHESKNNPSPPSQLQRQQKIERQRQNHSGVSSNRSNPGSRSGRSREQR